MKTRVLIPFSICMLLMLGHGGCPPPAKKAAAVNLEHQAMPVVATITVMPAQAETNASPQPPLNTVQLYASHGNKLIKEWNNVVPGTYVLNSPQTGQLGFTTIEHNREWIFPGTIVIEGHSLKITTTPKAPEAQVSTIRLFSASGLPLREWFEVKTTTINHDEFGNVNFNDGTGKMFSIIRGQAVITFENAY